MSVETVHPLYEKRSRQWEIVRDCYEGEDAIKSKGEKYLPRANGTPDKQYDAYRTRARWVNYFGRTLNGLHGLMFRRYPVLTCPDEFRNSVMVKNIDRRGTELNQFVADTIHDMIIPTFGGYLVDMPQTDGPVNGLDIEEKGIRPYLRYYSAESIINWKTDIIDGVEQLILVVLKEEVEDDSNGDVFGHNVKNQYRVLILENGVYKQYLYTEVVNERKEKEFIPHEISIQIPNKVVKSIPFVFAPGNIPEKPMLMDLAYCNIGHYQKSADYENGVHLTTIPTGYVTGHGQDVDEDTGEKEILNLGADNFLMFPEPEAKVGTLVYSGVGLLHSENALAQAMSEMAVLGSRLVSPDKNVSETADAAKIHRAGENALLATFAKNVSEKITRVLNIMMDWAGIEGECTYELSTDYDTLSFDANALNALANLASNNKMPLPYLYFNLADGEYLPSDSSLEEFVTMLQMEQGGASPLEVAEYYRLLRSGAKQLNADEILRKYPKQQQIVTNPEPTEDKKEDFEQEE